MNYVSSYHQLHIVGHNNNDSWNNNSFNYKLIQSFLLFVLITLSTYFLNKKIPSKFLLTSKSRAAYTMLILLTDNLINLISCTKQMSTSQRSDISTISPDLPLRISTLTLYAYKSQTHFLDDVVAGWGSGKVYIYH